MHSAHSCSRRRFIKTSSKLFCAAGLTVPALHVAAHPGHNHFKIGGVDWELTKPADPNAIAVAARLGFDGLQVDLGDVKAFKEVAWQQKYRQMARDARIEIASLALGKLSDSCFSKDERGQRLVSEAIAVARSMQQHVLLLAFFGANDIEKGENKTDALVGRLKEIAPAAEKAGVILGVEGETSVERYRRIIDEVNSPAVRVYFDCVHAHGNGRDIYSEITYLGDRICEFHAKDYGNILFGQGNLDWAAVRRGMQAIGYRGWIQIEQWAEVKGAKPLGFETTHRRNLAYLRTVLGQD